MVILGGLELVAAGYLLHEHNKNKRERKRVEQEEARLRHERRRQQQRHSNSLDGGHRGRSDPKYDYASPPIMQPPNAGPSTLAVPQGPPGRSRSQPPPVYVPNPNPAYPQSFPPPPNPPGPPPKGYSYGQYPPPPPPPPPSFPTPPPQQGQGVAVDNMNEPNGARQRSESDPNLPVGIAELSADGPWMHDPHRTNHQTPHVRFNFPDDVPQPGDDRSPPPAYAP